MRTTLSRWIGFFLAASAWAAPASDLLDRTPAEERELADRLRRFYAEPADRAPLAERTPKFDAATGQRIYPHAELAGVVKPPGYFGVTGEEPVRWWAEIESNDRVQTLAESWIPAGGLTTALDELPVSGTVTNTLWSDGYWRTRWGETSHRFARQAQFATWEEAERSYRQPEEWQGLVSLTGLTRLAGLMLTWSPAEKYDLTVGDENFSLTRQQKARGRRFLAGGQVPSWIGLCQGWAAASLMVTPPNGPAEVVGARGTRVTWYPSDVRAMATLAWANGRKDVLFVGGRCDSKRPETYPNGRLKQQECFDTNPATFHMALGNFVGRYRSSFLLDKQFDYEVWNQPVHSYRTIYFNPLYPQARSNRWRDVAVPYDGAFKSRDRFQRPLTRGRRHGTRYDDSRIQWVVGAVTTIVYADGVTPISGRRGPGPNLVRETYTYDLEIEGQEGKWSPTGGEWHQNAHPDFLWIPRRGSTPLHASDDTAVAYEGQPTGALTAAAASASADGYPLCRVVKELVRQSAGADGFRCPGDPALAPGVGVGVVPPGCRESEGPATVEVQVAFADTQVWFQGVAMGAFSRGLVRTFQSPALEGCRDFHYTIRLAHWSRSGPRLEWRDQTVRLKVRAGSRVRVTLDEWGRVAVARFE